MKKKILFSLLSLVVCMFTMTACSNDDDDDNNNGTTSELKLTSMVEGDGSKTDFTYDNQGRIKSVHYFIASRNGTHDCVYTYQDNKIVVEETDNESPNKKYITEYTLKDGLIVEALESGNAANSKYTYTYDKDRQLVSIIEKNEDRIYETSTSINWKDGNVESWTRKRGNGQWQATYQYTSVSAMKIGYFMNCFGMEQMRETALTKFFGKQPKNLPSAIHESNDWSDENGNIRREYENDVTYSYGFEGKDGYVSSGTATITEKRSGSSEKTETSISKFTWE